MQWLPACFFSEGEPLRSRISRSTRLRDMRPRVRPDMIPAKHTRKQQMPAYAIHVTDPKGMLSLARDMWSRVNIRLTVNAFSKFTIVMIKVFFFFFFLWVSVCIWWVGGGHVLCKWMGSTVMMYPRHIFIIITEPQLPNKQIIASRVTSFTAYVHTPLSSSYTFSSNLYSFLSVHFSRVKKTQILQQ